MHSISPHTWAGLQDTQAQGFALDQSEQGTEPRDDAPGLFWVLAGKGYFFFPGEISIHTERRTTLEKVEKESQEGKKLRASEMVSHEL